MELPNRVTTTEDANHLLEVAADYCFHQGLANREDPDKLRAWFMLWRDISVVQNVMLRL